MMGNFSWPCRMLSRIPRGEIDEMAQQEPVTREILTRCCLIWICPLSLAVKWSESRSNCEAGRAVRELGKMWGLLPRGGLDSSQGTRAGAWGLGRHLVLSYILCILFAAKSWTKYKKLVTVVTAGRMRNWMGWSAPEECLAQSSSFQNFPALAGVRLCGHHQPCQGDLALTREHRGESPLRASHRKGHDEYQLQRYSTGIKAWPVTEVQYPGQLWRMGKKSDQSPSPPFFLEGSVWTKCLIAQGENIWKDKERRRNPALYSWNWSLWMSSPRPVCT